MAEGICDFLSVTCVDRFCVSKLTVNSFT